MSQSGALDRRTLLERALKHERITLLAVVAVISAACWAWIVPMARDMYGSMTGASAWMMRTEWQAPHLTLLWAMWMVMMTAMMLPSASPALMLYAAVERKGADEAHREGHVYIFALGYLVVWAVFSAAATALQREMSAMLVLSPMMELESRPVIVGFLLVAGIFQLTPLKNVCLGACRSPAAFLTTHWRKGPFGALRMGIQHGLFCLGCCWALMLLLFVGGVMNLTVILALTIVVLVEKLTPWGVWVGRLGGVLLIAAAIYQAFP
jgi:predicted metal-binding membrane protein